MVCIDLNLNPVLTVIKIRGLFKAVQIGHHHFSKHFYQYLQICSFIQTHLFYRGNIEIINSSMDQTQKGEKKKDQQPDEKKEKKISQPKNSKKAKRKDSQDSDEDFRLYIQDKPKKRKKNAGENQNTLGQEAPKKRGRKPKPQPENKQNGEKEANSHQLPPEAPIVKKRGRPKGSTNKAKEKKEEPKVSKQFECLKKIQPKEKEASSLQDESESEHSQLNTKKQGQVEEKKDVNKISNLASSQVQKCSDGNPQKKQESQLKGASNQENQQSESQQNQQKQSEKESQQESQSQDCQSQISSEKPNKGTQVQKSGNKKPTSVQKPSKQTNSQDQSKLQQLRALPRGKKLNIKSSSQQSQQQVKNQSKRVNAETQKGQKVNQAKNQPSNVITQKSQVNKDQNIPEEEELAKLMKKRGRKSHQTQLQIQRLKEIVNKKKAEFSKGKIQSKSEKANPQKTQMQNGQEQSESQEQQMSQELSDDHANMKNPKQNNNAVQQKSNKLSNNQKVTKEQNRVQRQSSNKQKMSLIAPQKLSLVDKKQLEKEIITEKMTKLAMQSKICSEIIKIQTPVDPIQYQLFRGWTKYYKKYVQSISLQAQEEQIQLQSSRKRPVEKKFKKYRKVIIEEEDSNHNQYDQEARIVKKVRRQKRLKEPVKVIVHKKSKSKRKHKSHSSSESDN